MSLSIAHLQKALGSPRGPDSAKRLDASVPAWWHHADELRPPMPLPWMYRADPLARLLAISLAVGPIIALLVWVTRCLG